MYRCARMRSCSNSPSSASCTTPPLHGYVLRRHIAALTGHVRPVAESTLYPAIKRLEKAGLLVRASEPGAVAAPRQCCG